MESLIDMNQESMIVEDYLPTESMRDKAENAAAFYNQMRGREFGCSYNVIDVTDTPTGGGYHISYQCVEWDYYTYLIAAPLAIGLLGVASANALGLIDFSVCEEFQEIQC